MSDDMNRLAVTLISGSALMIAAGCAVLAQSKAPDLSKEWPTYGHDPGGMRYSPLTQITPANVAQLKIAWTYHMKPAGPLPPVGRGPVAAVGEEAPPPAGAGGGGGRRGGRGGGAGFRPSEATPLVIDGMM